MMSEYEEDSTKSVNMESVTMESESESKHKEDIRFVPFSYKDHAMKSVPLTFREFPFPENILNVLGNCINCRGFGVVALDGDDDKIVGYFLGSSHSRLGFTCKKVGHLTIVCVDSKYQNQGIAKRMGKYMMEEKHPFFSVDDYDEILIQDTDTWNSPSWIFSDRIGFRYCPTHDLIRRFGIFGYLQLILSCSHILPGQFMKRYVKDDEEEEIADAHEKQRGIIACLLSGILPAVFWIISWAIGCGDAGIRGSFVGYVFLVVYGLLIARFALAHAMTSSNPMPIVFREYDFWWHPIGLGLGWPLAIFGGFPLLGWTGGFYFGSPGENYLLEENRWSGGVMYLPINLMTLGILFLQALLRTVLYHDALPINRDFFEVLFYAAFFCSITDIATPLVCFPSGALAVRRWNKYLFAILWLCWLAILLISILVPDDDVPTFLNLSNVACQRQ